MAAVPRYRRVLLKISGEALMGSQSYGIDVSTVERIAADIKEAFDSGSEICVVIGGGNAKRLKELPPGCRLGDNVNAFEGGCRLWQNGAE